MVTDDRRTRKRLATRRAISDVATRLFYEKGFDRVTIDEIADAADVGRMTVFNHFRRKEDLIFDLNETGSDDLISALEQIDPDLSPDEALRLFVHRAVVEEKAYICFSPESQKFIKTVEASESLKARAREIRDELALLIVKSLSRPAGANAEGVNLYLMASVILSTWSVAFIAAHRSYQIHQDAEQARALFLAIVDKGSIGVKAMMAEMS